MSGIVTRRKAAGDADVAVDPATEDASETRSMRRRSAASTPTAAPSGSAKVSPNEKDGLRRKSSAGSDDKEGPSADKGMKTRSSIGTPPATPVVRVTKTMVTRERKDSPIRDEGGVIYKSRLVQSRKRSLTEKESEIIPADNLGSPPRKRRTVKATAEGQEEKDYFCWLCHKEGEGMATCELCPRSYHSKCLGTTPSNEDWVCPECEKIMRAECVDTQSKAMKSLSLDQLCMVLNFALQRLKHSGSKPFQKPVDTSQVPNYRDYITQPMDLDTIEKNIKRKVYGSTEAFLADVKWIMHNCIIFNGVGGKLTAAAKLIVKIAKHETSEVEVCPECYLNSYLKKNSNWFCEPCKPPHTLIWAKLKGYPFWPAKALREVGGQVDVRFFGAHDRSWVPVSQVYLLSEEPPVPVKVKKWGFDDAMEELDTHISRIKVKFGTFNYSAFRVPYDPKDPYSPEKYRSGKIEISESSPVKKFKADKSGEKTYSKPLLKSPVSTVKTFFSKAPLAKRAFKQAVLMKSATKTASSVRNKYSNIASSQRARLAKLKSIESVSDKSGTENKAKSDEDTDDDAPIGDQLASLFGEGTENSEKDCEENEDMKGKESKDKQIEIKARPDPIHESDSDEVTGILETQIKKTTDNDKNEELNSSKESDHQSGVFEMNEKALNKEDTKLELTLDPKLIQTDIPKPKLPDKSILEKIEDKVLQRTDTGDSSLSHQNNEESAKTNHDVERTGSRSDNGKGNSGETAKCKELEHLDSGADSIDGDRAYNTESDSDLAALRKLSMALQDDDSADESNLSNTNNLNKLSDSAADGLAVSEKKDREPLNNNSIIQSNEKATESKSTIEADSTQKTIALDKSVNSYSGETVKSTTVALDKKGTEDSQISRVTAPTQSDADKGKGIAIPGTSKKNPFLENLVESCKAKLGVNEEELKSDIDEDDEDMDEDDKDESEVDGEAETREEGNEDRDEEEEDSESESEVVSTSDDDGKNSSRRESVEGDETSQSKKRRRSASDVLQDLLKKSVESVNSRRSSTASGESSASSKSRTSDKPSSEVGSAKRKPSKTMIQDIRKKKKVPTATLR